MHSADITSRALNNFCIIFLDCEEHVQGILLSVHAGTLTLLKPFCLSEKAPHLNRDILKKDFKAEKGEPHVDDMCTHLCRQHPNRSTRQERMASGRSHSLDWSLCWEFMLKRRTWDFFALPIWSWNFVHEKDRNPFRWIRLKKKGNKFGRKYLNSAATCARNLSCTWESLFSCTVFKHSTCFQKLQF